MYSSVNNEHIVKLYDENSVNANAINEVDIGSFTTMHISGDYTSFYVEGIGKEHLENYNYMKIVDSNTFLLDFNTLSSTGKDISSTGDNNTCILRINVDSPVVISSSDGKTLYCTGYDLSGDINVYDYDFFGDERGVIVKLIVDNDTYSVKPISEFTDCALYNRDNYMSISGTSLDSINMDFDKGIQVDGNDYYFEAFLSTQEIVNDYGETNLVSVSGNAESDVCLTVNGTVISVETDSNITDVSVTNLVDNQCYTEKIGELSNDTSIPKLLLDYGDADGDGDITIIDATFIQRYLAELTMLSEKNLLAADADADDEVTILDATLIQRYLAELIDKIGL